MLDEGEMQEDPNRNFCINLLKAMELDDKENEDGLEETEQNFTTDQEMVALPEEWVYAIANEEEGETQTEMEAKTQTEDKEADRTEEMVQGEKAQPKSKKTKKETTKTDQETRKWGLHKLREEAQDRCRMGKQSWRKLRT
jgi:hypothetical protein